MGQVQQMTAKERRQTTRAFQAAREHMALHLDLFLWLRKHRDRLPVDTAWEIANAVDMLLDERCN